MPRIIHFDVPCDDLGRARTFYGTVFGWTFEAYGEGADYWLATTGPESEPGINGGLGKRDPSMPCTVNTVGVPDIDAHAKIVEANGGKLVTPTMPLPGIGWLRYCMDTEGNAFGLYQDDPSAK